MPILRALPHTSWTWNPGAGAQLSAFCQPSRQLWLTWQFGDNGFRDNPMHVFTRGVNVWLPGVWMEDGVCQRMNGLFLYRLSISFPVFAHISFLPQVGASISCPKSLQRPAGFKTPPPSLAQIPLEILNRGFFCHTLSPIYFSLPDRKLMPDCNSLLFVAVGICHLIF